MQESEPSVEKHGVYDNVSNGSKPSWIEITVGTGSNTKRDRLFAEVSINQKENEGSVEELEPEGEFCDVHKLHSFSLEVNPCNQGDNYGSNNIVHSCNEVTKRVVNQ